MGVNLVILAVRRPLPVYPDEQTSSESVGMSQTCQQETFRCCDLQRQRHDAGKSTDEFRVSRSGLRFAVNPQFDQRSRLAAAISAGA
jgi:hypothetical protein